MCNFNCDFCPINQSKREKNFMEFSLFKKGIDEIAKENITDTVGFHILGEPFIYPQIIDALCYAKEKGLKLDLTTNGSLLNHEVVKKLINMPVDKLCISIETTDAKEHEYRGSSISFDKYYKTILETIRMIYKSNASIDLELPLMNTFSKKYFEFDKTIRMDYDKKDYDEKIAYFIFDIYSAIDMTVDEDKIRSQLKVINKNKPITLRIAKNIKIFVQPLADWGNAFTSKKIYPLKYGMCGYGLKNIGILNNGEVTICCVDYDGKTSIGNLYNESLSDVLSSQRALDIQAGFDKLKIVDPYCQYCLGSTSRFKTCFKGILSIYIFKILQFLPGKFVKEVSLIQD